MMLVGEGMSAPFSRLSAMVNARGAEMSSRQMAPKVERARDQSPRSVRVRGSRERGRHRPRQRS